jgi:3-phosphoshikimate 1-carboxyvinyltransferase
LAGAIPVPSDKSLTHRAYLFGAIAEGPSEVGSPLRSEDCEATRCCLEALGARFEDRDGIVRVLPRPWSAPSHPLDCGNSGTTMRLLAGLIAARPLEAVLIGDASLSRRPMRRIAEPLRQMGATVEGDHAPLRIQGGHLRAIRYQSPVASAQVKSCVLLAGLGAEGTTGLREPSRSRDHTERMLRAAGVRLDEADGELLLEGGQKLNGFRFRVPGDISSAAFWMVAAALIPNSEIVLEGVGVNPTRIGILDVFQQAGIAVGLENERAELGEPVADLVVGSAPTLRPFRIDAPLVPRLVDEIPILAVLATQAEGVTEIRDAQEVRVKESDRIQVVGENLVRMGAKVEILPDGLRIEGPTPLTGIAVDAGLDHRIAMTFAIAGMIADGETRIYGEDSIATSYPDFVRHWSQLTHV